MRLSSVVNARRTIGLTALIDVVFLLLVFFMLASTFLKFSSVRIEAGTAGPATHDLTKIVLVQVGKGNQVRINGEELKSGSVSQRLEALRKAGRQLAVVVVGADAAVSDFLAVVAIARRTGFKSVAVVR